MLLKKDYLLLIIIAVKAEVDKLDIIITECNYFNSHKSAQHR